MRTKKIIVPVLATAVVFCLVCGLSAAQKEKAKAQGKQAQQEKVFIPKEVKAIMAEGLATKQGRQDIPVNVFYSLYLPAQQNFHDTFFLKIKNSALGFAPVTAAPPAPPAPPKKGPQVPAAQETAAVLQANFYFFAQFNLYKEGAAAPADVIEMGIPCAVQVPSAGFDPEAEDTYTFGVPIPAGHYLLAVAVTSPDLKKVGTAYYDFTVAPASSYAKTLDTTPIFFVKQMEQMESVETRTVLHRTFFTYSVLKIFPNLDKVFSAGQNLDVFFFVFGTQANAQGQNELEVTFEVKKGEESAVKWSAQTYPNPLISQPLPLKQTLSIKSAAGERTESKDLPPGAYTLAIKIHDKVADKTVNKTVDFTVK